MTASPHPQFHLAQINIAKAKADLTSPTMTEFVDRLDEINQLAERAPGFIWRLQTEEGDATSLNVFNDPSLIINMSVWRDIESLQDYVYQSLHLELLKGKKSWFSRMDGAQQALWWIDAGHIPSVEEGKIRLQMIQTQGPTAKAFNFAHPYPQS